MHIPQHYLIKRNTFYSCNIPKIGYHFLGGECTAHSIHLSDSYPVGIAVPHICLFDSCLLSAFSKFWEQPHSKWSKGPVTKRHMATTFYLMNFVLGGTFNNGYCMKMRYWSDLHGMSTYCTLQYLLNTIIVWHLHRFASTFNLSAMDMDYSVISKYCKPSHKTFQTSSPNFTLLIDSSHLE